MSMMECAHCKRAADSRSMMNCESCSGMICESCGNTNEECPGEDIE